MGVVSWHSCLKSRRPVYKKSAVCESQLSDDACPISSNLICFCFYCSQKSSWIILQSTPRCVCYDYCTVCYFELKHDLCSFASCKLELSIVYEVKHNVNFRHLQTPMFYH